MIGAVALQPTELVPARPFTHPQHIRNHQHILGYMLKQLGLQLEYFSISGRIDERLTQLQRSEGGDWFHRLLLARPQPLAAGGPLTLVGFFGERLPDADVDVARELDRNLMMEIDDHPGLYSYSTIALKDGNYANMVLFGSPEARLHWSTSRTHAVAVQELSPAFYKHVAIYNGRLPAGLSRIDQLQLVRAKYFDYRSHPCWRAVRELVSV